MSNKVYIILPEDYNNFDYSKLLVLHILPLLAKYKGTNLNCTYKNFTNIEVKFPDNDKAYKAVKELNNLLKKIKKVNPDMLSTKNNKNEAIAKLLTNKISKLENTKTKKCKLPDIKKTKKQY